MPFKSANRNLRSTLPPLAAQVDNVRQFNELGKTPRFRVIPLPVNLTSGGGSVVNVTKSTSSGGGSSTTTGVTSIVASTVTINASIGPSSAILSSAVMARSFQLLSVIATAAVSIRLYGNSSAQALDSFRGIDAPVPAELGQDLITDLVLDTAPYTWNWQDRIGANSDTTQNTNIYITLLNPSTLSDVVSVAIKFVPLQTG